MSQGATKNILVGVTGSVATIKLPVILDKLKKQSKFNVKVIFTENSKHFVDVGKIKELAEVFSDQDEWSTWKNRGDPILHIDLIKWADLFIISPLDANTLAKISNGLCDNLLTSAVRAWDLEKPLLFCPAMNTKMYEHPLTQQQTKILKSFGYEEIPCISKTLMCGDTGLGAMAEVDFIIKAINCKFP